MTTDEIRFGLLTQIPRKFQARIWRQNVLATKIGDRFIAAGLAGMADLSGIIEPGYRLEIEIKGPGDRMKPKQISWGRMIEAHGGIFIVARDVEKTLADLRMRLEMRTK